jgi:GNAT superfamily N-acetyltransferase
MNIVRHAGARNFLNRAEGWLLSSEAQNNLIFAIANQLLHDDHSYEDPIYLATIEDGNRVAGCAWRTPPFKLGLTQLPIESLPALASDIATVYDSLSAVIGPEPEAIDFANCWSRQVGVRWAAGMRQRIYCLERVNLLARPASGSLRKAEVSDLSLLSEWGAGFNLDAGVSSHEPRVYAERSIRRGSLYIWEDQEPRSMAAASGSTPNGTRVGYVYTPPEFRNHGYATSVVSSLSQLLLEAGHRFCFLYTDLANPVSNKIYEKIGYGAVGDAIDVSFL